MAAAMVACFGFHQATSGTARSAAPAVSGAMRAEPRSDCSAPMSCASSDMSLLPEHAVGGVRVVATDDLQLPSAGGGVLVGLAHPVPPRGHPVLLSGGGSGGGAEVVYELLGLAAPVDMGYFAAGPLDHGGGDFEVLGDAGRALLRRPTYWSTSRTRDISPTPTPSPPPTRLRATHAPLAPGPRGVPRGRMGGQGGGLRVQQRRRRAAAAVV